jgi:hypothetical protein
VPPDRVAILRGTPAAGSFFIGFLSGCQENGGAGSPPITCTVRLDGTRQVTARMAQ